MRRFALLSLFVFVGGPVEAASPAFDSIPCKSAIAAALGKAPEGFDWRTSATIAPSGRAYRAPTGEFGAWYELTVESEQNVATLARFSHASAQHTRWEAPACAPVTTTGAWSAATSAKDKLFTDADLAAFLRKNPRAVIYIWSPGMIYSSEYLKFFRTEAGKEGAAFLTLLAPESNAAAAADVAEIHGFASDGRKVASVELAMRARSSHYPRILFAANGKLSREPLYGVMPRERFLKFARAAWGKMK